MPITSTTDPSYFNRQTKFTTYDPNYQHIAIRELYQNAVDNYKNNNIQNEKIIISSDFYIHNKLGIDLVSVQDFGNGIDDHVFNTKYTVIGNGDNENFGLGSRFNCAKANRDGFFVKSIYMDSSGYLQMRILHVFFTNIYKDNIFKGKTFKGPLLFVDIDQEYSILNNDRVLEHFLYNYAQEELKVFQEMNEDNIKTGTRVTLLSEVKDVLLNKVNKKNYKFNLKESSKCYLNFRYKDIPYSTNFKILSQKSSHPYYLHGFNECLSGKSNAHSCIDVLDLPFDVYYKKQSSYDEHTLAYKLKITAVLAKEKEGGRNFLNGSFANLIFNGEGYALQPVNVSNDKNYEKYPLPYDLRKYLGCFGSARKKFSIFLEIEDVNNNITPDTDRLSLIYKDDRTNILNDINYKSLITFYIEHMSEEMNDQIQSHIDTSEEYSKLQEAFISLLQYKKFSNLNLDDSNQIKSNDAENTAQKTLDGRTSINRVNNIVTNINTNNSKEEPQKRKRAPNGNLSGPYKNGFLNTKIPIYVNKADFEEEQKGNNSAQEADHIYFTKSQTYINEESELVQRVLNKHINRDSTISTKGLLALAIALFIAKVKEDEYNKYKKANLPMPNIEKLEENICLLDSHMLSDACFYSEFRTVTKIKI